MTKTFMNMVRGRWEKGFFVSVGLDSDPAKIPACVQGANDFERQSNFNTEIIMATADVAGCYKANSSFYERLKGGMGLAALDATIAAVHKYAPGVPAADDGKRGDIGNSSEGYAESAFDNMSADAITLNPYMGQDALEPFLERFHEGSIVICRTSNEGAKEFQDRLVLVYNHELNDLLPANSDEGSAAAKCGWHKLPNGYLMPLYQLVAMRVARVWNKLGNCAIVAGATYPEELGMLRYLTGDLPFLIPAVGFQQKGVPLEKQIEQVVKNAADSKGEGMVINASRSLIFASSGEDFAEAARNENIKMNQLINSFR